ncbi:hypothetical protein [uncultured Campylobacter sp.]|uniref:hypothetical protein n=1 Tax=uncultured Campylobacter sp. TaxID=218934 RepID=UPI00262FA7BC|nr:hypothetical protein [uncultured Campylobacter sp.]
MLKLAAGTAHTGRDTARRRLATDKHDKVRQEASMAKKLNFMQDGFACFKGTARS